MPGIVAFIPFIAGEYIQIGSVQLNSMTEQILEITFYIIRRLGAAQISLRPAGPPLMRRYGPVRQPGGIFFVISLSVKIIVSVLIMDSE